MNRDCGDKLPDFVCLVLLGTYSAISNATGLPEGVKWVVLVLVSLALNPLIFKVLRGFFGFANEAHHEAPFPQTSLCSPWPFGAADEPFWQEVRVLSQVLLDRQNEYPAREVRIAQIVT